jgi:hypothetical protein
MKEKFAIKLAIRHSKLSAAISSTSMRNALMPSDSASTRNFTPYCALTEQTTAASTQANIAAWAIHRRRMNRYIKSKGRLEYRLRSAIRYEISSRSRPSGTLPPRRTELVNFTERRASVG